MKNIFTITTAAFVSLFLVSCGGEKEEEEAVDGPQSPQGKILNAAENAMEKANEKTKELEEARKGLLEDESTN